MIDNQGDYPPVQPPPPPNHKPLFIGLVVTGVVALLLCLIGGSLILAYRVVQQDKADPPPATSQPAQSEIDQTFVSAVRGQDNPDHALFANVTDEEIIRVGYVTAERVDAYGARAAIGMLIEDNPLMSLEGATHFTDAANTAYGKE